MNIPPPPKPPSYTVSMVRREQTKRDLLTNRAAISISMLEEKPQAAVPRAAKNTAVWFAPLRPMTLHKRPYKGVKVHVARRYLTKPNVKANSRRAELSETNAVPSQLA